MMMFAQFALYLWLPVVVGIFAAVPSTRKAVVSAFVFAWLALPTFGIPIPGLPDYTKMSATVAGILLCMCLFDQGRFFSIRFRWFDLPILLWCFGPFVTAISNDMGPYEGASAVLAEMITWGFPYLIGRAYLIDLDGIRDLAEAIAVGGLCYVPLCLFEIRFSPVLAMWIYGYTRWDGVRYGGYRPKVFLTHGLELGIWMTNATMISYMLWANNTIRSIKGISFSKLTLVIAVTTFLCKSTGAILLLVFGVGLLWVVKRTKWAWLMWLMILIPPAYTSSRGLGLWSGRELIEFSKASFGEDRAQSLEYRIDMENRLIGRSSERPILGWGRFNRFQVLNEQGNVTTVPDGFWIIAQGTQGSLGLVSILALFLMPLILTMRRFPISTWSDPQVGPVVAIAVVLALTMIDFLSNAMLNPIYPLAIGGILGQVPYRPKVIHGEAEESLAMASSLVAEGRSIEARMEFQRAIEWSSIGKDIEGRTIQANALDGLGQTFMATGQYWEAEQALRDALVIRDWLAAGSSDPDRFRDLAIAREGLARALTEVGRSAESIGERGIALQIWEILATDHPRNDDYQARRANSLNDLAWLLVTDPNPGLCDPARAVTLAEEAIRVSADHDAFWNTLGVARYRFGDWAGAIEALERSALSSPGGLGTAFDHYYLAMAWYRLGDHDRAREWVERGNAWTVRHRPNHPMLDRARREAESLLNLENQHSSGESV